MKFKYCPECGKPLGEDFNFCPVCGFMLDDSVETKNFIKQKKEAYANFRESVLDVAETFFSMSEEDRQKVIKEAQERCDEAEARARDISLKKYN